MADDQAKVNDFDSEKNDFQALFADAKDEIVVVGVNPLSPYLESSAVFFSSLLKFRDQLRLTVLYENPTENFQLSTTIGASGTDQRKSFDYLSSHCTRISGSENNAGLNREILNEISEKDVAADVSTRISVKQLNLRLPVNIIKKDDQILYSLSIDSVATIDDYAVVEKDTPLYKKLLSAILTYTSPDRDGELFLSKPGDELIWVYDSLNTPRGVFPRKSFYTTDYGRYVVWVFVFNRNGQLLLQRRSEKTADNKGLWDKSVGGHVDLNDSSTSITAKRELVEEMYLPEAEFTQYVAADIGDIIDFGEWKTSKRPERCFIDNFNSLGPSDWVMFRATDTKGQPLTDRRISQRRFHGPNNKVLNRKTVFHSDCYFMIAPKDHLDTQEQVDTALRFSLEKGAASGHKLVDIWELRDWIHKEEKAGSETEVFTDDLIHIQAAYGGMLERFSEFVKFINREQK